MTNSLSDIPPNKILSMLPQMSESEMAQLLEELEILEQMKKKETASERFLPFVTSVWPEFISGRHHKIMADAFERVARGDLKRLIVNMPPRHTKSEFASYLLPAWYLGKFPNKKVIQCSHTADLAVGFGRKVRNLLDTDEYKELFPGVGLRADSKAAGRWNTNHNGDYFAIGVGGAVTGKGADLLIIDDPHAEQEATQAESNPEIYDKTYEWFTSGPRQRLQPGGAIVIVMCMTGDTPVLMSDGTEKSLRDVKPGDAVGTFDSGRLTTSKVLNHRSNGVDSIYRIQTQSGKILRANERHPFLVMNEGVLEWTRLKNLKEGDLLVSLKGAIDRREQKQNRVCAQHVCHENLTTAGTQTPRIVHLDIMVSGKEFFVRVANQFRPKGCAPSVIETKTRHQRKPRSKVGDRGSKIVTVLPLNNMKQWWRNATTFAMYVVNHQQEKILVPIGTVNCASTTIIKQEKYEDCCATIATSQLVTEKHQKHLNELENTSDFTVDPIVSIKYAGEEEVFDVQIDRTENFIANGIVSHNTRWSKKDVCGQILKASAQRGGDEWEVIEFPALFDDDRPLWPEFWSKEALIALRTELPNSKWQAQYQQNPTSDVSAIVKREWWRMWQEDEPPKVEFIIQSWDTAFLKTERSDYSACTTWGVFYKPDDTGELQANIILLNAFKERMEFPELKQRAMRCYKEWQPDSIIIEAKAAGSPLIFELRRMGVPVQEYTPSKGSDKIARMNAVSDLFASGHVWAPNRSWADEVIEEVASFPSSEHDDLCLVGDSMVLMGDLSEKRLDEVVEGDFVMTPIGPRKVLSSGLTGYKETIKIVTDSGFVEGTANHPVGTKDGWVNIEQIKPSDAVFALSEKEQSIVLKSAKVITTIDTRNLKSVYNLTVDEAHCFFANGLLVHNCDSTSQALLRFRRGGFIKLDSDYDDDEIRIPRKRAYY